MSKSVYRSVYILQPLIWSICQNSFKRVSNLISRETFQDFEFSLNDGWDRAGESHSCLLCLLSGRAGLVFGILTEQCLGLNFRYRKKIWWMAHSDYCLWGAHTSVLFLVKTRTVPKGWHCGVKSSSRESQAAELLIDLRLIFYHFFQIAIGHIWKCYCLPLSVISGIEHIFQILPRSCLWHPFL